MVGNKCLQLLRSTSPRAKKKLAASTLFSAQIFAIVCAIVDLPDLARPLIQQTGRPWGLDTQSKMSPTARSRVPGKHFGALDSSAEL